MKVYSSLSRAKSELEPRDPGRIGIYLCGPTVYDAPHLGHARSTLVFDVVRRYLTWRGYDVTFVSNFTDVDDRIIARAADEGTTSDEIAERYIGVWSDFMARLGVLEPDIAPRATEHIAEIIELIEALIESDKAYESGGDVYFSIAAYPGYGGLSGRRIDELEAGARVEPGEEKRDPLDFALWKAAKPGEPEWESPWGPGRPGWHIECTAMSLKYLGDGFDIHGAGQDLIFPHNENERAQSEALGHPFARMWMHNGLVNLEGEKMSKSTGNFVSLAEVLDQNDPEVVRLIALQTHYRKPLDFGPAELEQASSALERLRQFERRSRAYARSNNGADGTDGTGGGPGADRRDRFVAAMDDDFNSPEALAAVFDLVRLGNQAIDERRDPSEVGALASLVLELCGVLGLDLGDSDHVPAGAAASLVDMVLALRDEARAAKEWETADRLRDALTDMGVVVEDGEFGPEWHWRRGRS